MVTEGPAKLPSAHRIARAHAIPAGTGNPTTVATWNTTGCRRILACSGPLANRCGKPRCIPWPDSRPDRLCDLDAAAVAAGFLRVR